MKKVYKIAVTGPESTGKTKLSECLAGYFNTVWVPEYAREYLQKKGGNYDFGDIVKIAKGQKRREDEALRQASKFLICDTDPLVTKIWSEVVYGKVDPWIINEVENNPYDLYLLCYPDLPWEPDPLRENPDDRDKLFEIYYNELEKRNYNFKVIKGTGEERCKNAVSAVKNSLG